jgi:hypothetical protein
MSTRETMRRRFERDEFNALFADLDAPTDDEVTITTDGRRLDTVEAVLTFVTEVEVDGFACSERAEPAPSQRAGPSGEQLD